MNSHRPASLAAPPGIDVFYRQVKKILISEIASGALKPGVKFPNEKALAQRFGVSIGTLRRAVEELVAENILVRQQGRGTFVRKLDQERFLFQFFKLADRSGKFEYPLVKLASFECATATAEEAKALGLSGKSKVFRIENVLSLQGQPTVHDRIAIDARLFEGLTEAQLTGRSGTIYELYQRDFGITVAGADERLRAENADARSAQLLGLAPGASVLRIERVAYTVENLPCEWRISMVDTRKVEYVSRSSRA
jgi:GntR family transcriptional regulator